MDDASRSYLESQIRSLVLSGRTEHSELTESVLPELLEGEGIDDAPSLAWATELLDATWRSHAADALTWPRPTDVERLAQVFDTLTHDGFICVGVEGSAVTQSDVHDDVAELYHDAGGHDSSASRYIGFHAQDIEGAIDGDAGLFLMHGRIGDDGMHGDAETARLATAALTSAGFNVAWDGDPAKRIALESFVWRKSPPGALSPNNR